MICRLAYANIGKMSGRSVTRGGAIVDVHNWRGRRIVWAPHPAARITPDEWVDAVVDVATKG